MYSRIFTFLLIAVFSGFSLFGQKKLSKNKQVIISSVENHQDELIKLSDEIWAYAETALQESNSSKALANYAEKQGFKVERGVAEMPTAFIASYGSGKPIIGILGEFDALPGLSQKAQVEKEALEHGKPGHGCGHNLFGVGSFGAALAIKELMEQGKIKGTIRFYGTPAEETIGGKLYMARAGLFDDLDVCLDWHPGAKMEASTQSTQALIDFRVRFYGKAAHAAFDPWNGTSAVDAMELYTTGVNYLREHVKPTVRIHYLMENAGDVVNVVPENAVIWTRVRDRDRDGMLLVYEKVKKIAEGAALMTGTDYKIELISGMYEMLVNRTGAAALQANMELLGPILYSNEEIEFARGIQKVTGKEQLGIDGKINPLRETEPNPPGGSTDVGDVSWITPEISLSATTAPIGTAWHSWAVVACGGMSIGHKGMIFSAKALALTMVDLFENEKLVAAMRSEFKERKGNVVYEPILPEGPPPVK
ncbi:MAG: amidohydrolase [Cyclobacteriaceae bacterium]|nr:amidohydrolase [Cyclobacteriaceae bacterium]